MKRQPSLPVAALCAAFAFGSVAPNAASAEPLPSYALPPGSVPHGETIHGTISSVPSRDQVLVRDDRGFIDRVALHEGTIVNPSGVDLGSGQSVTITGSNGGSVFRADEIDVSDAADGPADAGYDEAPYVDPYPYPYYPYAYYPYGYYPGFGLGLGFYFGGHGGYGYHGGYGGYHGGYGGYHGGYGGYHGGYGGYGGYGGHGIVPHGVGGRGAGSVSRGGGGVARGGGGGRR